MPTTTSAKIAKMLLLRRGELSRSDLAALPWIKDEKEIDLVIRILQRSLNTKIQQRRIESSSVSEWEDVLVLESKH